MFYYSFDSFEVVRKLYVYVYNQEVVLLQKKKMDDMLSTFDILIKIVLLSEPIDLIMCKFDCFTVKSYFEISFRLVRQFSLSTYVDETLQKLKSVNCIWHFKSNTSTKPHI